MCAANSAPRDVGVVKWGRGAMVKGGGGGGEGRGHTRASKIAILHCIHYTVIDVVFFLYYNLLFNIILVHNEKFYILNDKTIQKEKKQLHKIYSKPKCVQIDGKENANKN